MRGWGTMVFLFIASKSKSAWFSVTKIVGLVVEVCMPQRPACQIWYPFICTCRDKRNSWCIKKYHRWEIHYCWASGTNLLSCGKHRMYVPFANKLVLHGQYEDSISDSKPWRFMHCVTNYVQHEYRSVQIMLKSRFFAQNKRSCWDISWQNRYSAERQDNWRTGKHLDGRKFSGIKAHDPKVRDSNPGTSRNEALWIIKFELRWQRTVSAKGSENSPFYDYCNVGYSHMELQAN
jgi:hypothetical protein